MYLALNQIIQSIVINTANVPPYVCKAGYLTEKKNGPRYSANKTEARRFNLYEVQIARYAN